MDADPPSGPAPRGGGGGPSQASGVAKLRRPRAGWLPGAMFEQSDCRELAASPRVVRTHGSRAAVSAHRLDAGRGKPLQAVAQQPVSAGPSKVLLFA
jgi:hypothetical protein